MIVWVKKEAVSMPCDQRADVLDIDTTEGRIYLNLCGTGDKVTVTPADLCGIELNSITLDSMSVLFCPTGYVRNGVQVVPI